MKDKLSIDRTLGILEDTKDSFFSVIQKNGFIHGKFRLHEDFFHFRIESDFKFIENFHLHFKNIYQHFMEKREKDGKL